MDEKLALIKQRLESAEKSVASAKKLLAEVLSGHDTEDLTAEDKAEGLQADPEARVVEGVFDGESMVGPDKRRYPVPANYASKSKLVEGDILKLTISADGSFVYKQIGPVERRRVSGELIKEPGGSFIIRTKAGDYRVLLASVTYFQAQEGDEVTIVIPKNTKAQWGAVENVIKQGGESTVAEKVSADKEEAIKDLENMTAVEGSEVDQLDEIDGLSGV